MEKEEEHFKSADKRLDLPHSWGSYRVKNHDGKAFDESTYFSSYHHAEDVICGQKYERQVIADFGKGTRTYNQSFFTINVWDRDIHLSECTKLVVEEVLSEEDRKALIPYCQCARCILPWYMFWKKQFICGCCVGCLSQSWNISQDVIDSARLAALK